MKLLFTLVVLVSSFLLFNSFAPEAYSDSYKDKGSLSASVDGNGFRLREKDFYRAMLVTKANALVTPQSARTKTVVSLTFYGNDTINEKGEPFGENISMEYSFAGVEGEAGDISFELHYDFGDYYMIPEENHFKVSSMDWSADKKSFLLTGEFEGTLRKQGYPSDSQPIVHLHGSVHDINVSVPPWIASKLNTRADVGQ